MKKIGLSWLSSYVILASLLLSCANPLIGKVLPEGNYPEISRDCRHHVVMKHIILDYDCLINDDDKTITFDGHAEMNENGFSDGWEVTELFFTVYFLDSERKVVSVGYISIWPNKEASEKIKFKKTFEYNPQYKYIGYSYKSKAIL
jgi:hypothetical protein